ncbi:Dam family site-specific DNA-(adenine-N6)-methyltransferase [Erwinia sp. Leaf53]|uniref:DNA adenine methylase n=1 Tax=Erwinia sp. Leaf53 TaxID=1736225 RepID=UPI0006FB1CD8|nr:Dam family site-specific DNA-(adenine-N6)-methyltransferase [Erwinia sp. Leaf53]KQN57982.1 DNA adenine methylase [Erwinia sp. Leaf53]
MNTVLKWVGSKSRIMPDLVKHLPAGRRLVEPFAGSCSVMMNTDYEEYLIADINPDLINMYQQIQSDSEKFITLADAVFKENRSEVAYYRIREEFNERTWPTRLTRAVYFLYLNRNGYRGLCRYNQKGDFNVPYGNYRKPYFPLEEIKAFAIKSQRALIFCADYKQTLSAVMPGDVVYCDPPYDGTFTEYSAGGFNAGDQAFLAGVLTQFSKDMVPVVVSNSDTQLVRELYASFEVVQVTAPRSIGVAAGEGKSAVEVIAVSSGNFAKWRGFNATDNAVVTRHA